MNEKKKKHLGTNLMIISIIFSLCICIGMGCIGIAIYYKSTINHYKKYISGILTMAAGDLDGDDLEQCINTLTESEKYKNRQKLLNQIRDSYDIEYIYMVKPLKVEEPDNMMYVISGISKEEMNDTDNAYLGKLSGSEYSEKVAEYYISAMSSEGITYYANKTTFGYMYSGLEAVRNSKGEAIAVLAVDVSIKEMVDVLTRYIQSIAAAGIIIAVIFFIALYRWIRRRVVVPIQKLDDAANDFVKKSHESLLPSELEFTDPEIHSGDEIQTLSDSLITLSNDLKSYMNTLLRETKEKERIESELSIATEIQASMLPCIFPPFPNVSEFDIYASMSPAKEVGGDFYDFFMIDENHLAVVMADVSGKGVPAALFMVIGKTLIKDYSNFGGSLGEVSHSNTFKDGTSKVIFYNSKLKAIREVVTGPHSLGLSLYKISGSTLKGIAYSNETYGRFPVYAFTKNGKDTYYSTTTGIKKFKQLVDQYFYKGCKKYTLYKNNAANRSSKL